MGGVAEGGMKLSATCGPARHGEPFQCQVSVVSTGLKAPTIQWMGATIHGYCHVRASRIPPKKLTAALTGAHELLSSSGSQLGIPPEAQLTELFPGRSNAEQIFGSAPITLCQQHTLVQELQLAIEATLPSDLPPTGSAPSGSFSYYLAVVVVLPGRQQCEPPLLLQLKSSADADSASWDPCLPVECISQFPGRCWDAAQLPGLAGLLKAGASEAIEQQAVPGAVSIGQLRDGPYNVEGAGDEQVCVVWLSGTELQPGQLFAGMLNFTNRNCTCEKAVMSLHMAETVHAAYSASGKEQVVEQLCAESCEYTEHIEQVGFMLPVSHQAVVSQQSAVLSIEWVLRIHFSVKTPADQGATETMTWEVPLTLVQERGSPADDQNSSATVSASYDL